MTLLCWAKMPLGLMRIRDYKQHTDPADRQRSADFQ